MTHTLTIITPELEALRARVAELEAALRPFADFYDCIDRDLPEDEDYFNEVGFEGHHGLTPGHFKTADALLTSQEGK